MAQDEPQHEEEDEEELIPEPDDVDPYEVLGVIRDASTAEIRTAYRKLALLNHPDKVPAQRKEEATANFQKIAWSYSILSDEKRRSAFDAGSGDGPADWAEFYKEQYQDVVSAENIAKFAEYYKGSDEEKDDILAAYETTEGNIYDMDEYIMLSDLQADESRWVEVIEEAIKQDDLEVYPAYNAYRTKSAKNAKALAKKLKSQEKEAKEAEKLAKELGLKKSSKKGADDTSDLAALIQQRQKGRAESFLDNLEAKYGGGKKRKMDDGPPESAFAEVGARAKKTKGKKG